MKTARKILAMVLALTMILAVCATASAAAQKAGQTKVKSAVAYLTANGFGLKYTWDEVKGATGYQYCYNRSYTSKSTSKDYKFATTAKNTVKIGLKKDYGAVDFKVRAYKVVDGKKVYGEWATGRLKRAQVDSLISKQVKKKMQSYDLFMKATAKKVAVRKGAGKSYEVIGAMKRLDEAKTTGKFKRDSSGKGWSQVHVSKDQYSFVIGWVSEEDTRPVWYKKK